MKTAEEIVAGRFRTAPEDYYQGPLKQAPSQKDFYTYLFMDNKIYSLLMLFLMLCEFIIFKLMYPYPDFFSDSYSYIFAAYAHLDVNIWPIGYSKFLLLFHWFTHSATALNYFQFLFLGVAALYFYHTIVYFYPTGKTTRTILCLFLFFNPLNLYLANYVTSDAIFIGLSLFWLSEMIWILNRPRLSQVFIQAIIFFIAFTFRYNAMYYPLIGAVVFLLSRQKAWVKALGIVLGPLLIIPFILFSSNAAKKMTGTAQFPPILGGWQWGNNALYMREYIHPDTTQFPTLQTAELDQLARNFYRNTPPEQRQLSAYVANFFIRQPNAPLKQYMSRHYQPKDGVEDVAAWGKVAPVFGQYGLYLVKKYPLAYFQHYMLVNAVNYFLPPLEKLEVYNLGTDEMWPIAQYWFSYPSPKVTCISKTLQGTLLYLFTSFFMILNIYGAIAFYLFVRRGGLRKSDKYFRYTVLAVGLFLLLNAGFSIFANIIVIRYEVFPMIVFLTFTMLLTDWLELTYRSRKQTSTTVPIQIPANILNKI